MQNVDNIKNYFNTNDTFAQTLGIEVVEMGDGYGAATMPLEQKQRNGMGNAHGGAIFALMDMAFAAASHASGTYSVNAQSSISYLESGRVGPLRGEARKLRVGRRMSTYEVSITDADGTLVAAGIVTGYNTGKALPADMQDAVACRP